MSEVETENNHNKEEELEEEKEKENRNSPTTRKAKVEWTTWEELLLACAVKRHGLKDWDSVAMELQTRCFPTTTTATTNTVCLTPQICRDKFRDLQRRFTASNDDVAAAEDDGGDDVTVPWLEELRKLRVAELKQEVHRYDLSIQSLQLKVKRLEEEREGSLKENDENDDVKTDLEKDKNTANSVKHEDEERSENDKKGAGEEPPEDVTGKSVSGEDDNRSFNESNSTDNRGTGSKAEPEPVEVKPETVEEVKPVPAGGEDSCNDSSDRGKASQEGKLDSVDESKEGTTTKENSDVQSSASLTRKKRRRGGRGDSGTGGGGKEGGGDGGVDAATTTTTTTTTGATRREGVVVKSEPLIGFLDIIRSHKQGSMFERRLDVQKADKYKNMVRQHVDLQTIQSRIDDGSYSSCSNKFYLDMLLVFNNAIVFFPKSSPESLAAHELRDIVMKEIKKNRVQSSDPPSEPASAKVQLKPDTDRAGSGSGSGSDSLLAKHKSTAPLVVCRKRSSIAAKASSSSAATKVEKVEKLADNKPLLNSKPAVKSSSSTQNEDDSSIKLKLKEKPVTGVRSMRRSSKGRPNSNATTPSNTNSNQNTTSSSSQQQQPPPRSAHKSDDAKTDKKKPELNNAAAKKRGAADFLKRMKKNSPGKGSSAESLIGSTDDSKGGKSDQQKKKVEERKDTGPLRRSGNGNGKQAKEDNSPSKRSVGRPPKKGKDPPGGKRGREGGEGEGSTKRPNKRSRR